MSNGSCFLSTLHTIAYHYNYSWDSSYLHSINLLVAMDKSNIWLLCNDFPIDIKQDVPELVHSFALESDPK